MPTRFAAILLLSALAAGLPEQAAPASDAGPRDRAELEAYLDGLLAGLMRERHVPGAVALVVRDGAVFFAKGYGVADLESGRPVDPETTLFRVASVSKLFTTTAALQQVEAGKLDLHADVNQYLSDFKLAEAFGKPVTLAHLLTHTGGFDDSFLGSAQPLDAEPIPLGTYLARRMPRRVMPPGELISYSNHGLALAGHLVERASGEPFAEYVRRHVLEPLGMTRSGFGLPNPPPPELAAGYDWRYQRYEPVGVDRLLMGPAGDLYTSAADISRFMLAELQLGRLGSARILREETARLMQSRQFTHHPQLTGWCYGFVEDRRNGVRIVQHGGSWRGYGTLLALDPESGVGLFISTTREYQGRFFEPILDGFFARYYPRVEAPPRAEPPADRAARAPRYAGSYVPNRRIRSDFLKLGLFMSESSVTANEDGSLTLRVPGDFRDPLRLIEVEPELFEVDGKARFASFRSDAHGRVAHLILDSDVLDRVPWYQAPATHRNAAAVSALVFAATLVGYPFAALARRLLGGRAASAPRAARIVVVSVSALDLTTLGAIAVGLARVSPYELFERVPGWLTAVSVLPLVSLPLSLALPGLLVRSFHAGDSAAWTPLARLHFALLTLSAAFFAIFVWYWNLLGILR